MIRRATPDDALAIAMLYHDAVKKINSRDYAPAQIQAWAGVTPDEEKWLERQTNRTTAQSFIRRNASRPFDQKPVGVVVWLSGPALGSR
jgi:hypothetical protein